MPTDSTPPPEAIDAASLETVTGGTNSAATGVVGSNDFTSAMSSLASTLKNLDNVKQSSGFSDSTMMCLAMMAMESRGGGGGFGWGGGGGTTVIFGRGRRGC